MDEKRNQAIEIAKTMLQNPNVNIYYLLTEKKIKIGFRSVQEVGRVEYEVYSLSRLISEIEDELK